MKSLFTLIIIAALAGCANNPVAPRPGINMTGSWTATASGTVIATMYLVQTGDSIAGAGNIWSGIPRTTNHEPRATNSEPRTPDNSSWLPAIYRGVISFGKAQIDVIDTCAGAQQVIHHIEASQDSDSTLVGFYDTMQVHITR